MNDRDVEQLLHDALEAKASALVPDSRVAPQREWRRRGAPGRWTAPLAVAAAALLIAGTAAVVSQRSASTTAATPATGTVTNSPSDLGPVGTPTGTASPTVTSDPSGPLPTTGPATPPGPAPSVAPTGSLTSNTTTPATPATPATPTTVGGASVDVPSGWSIHPWPTSDVSQPISQTWCLTPISDPTGCVIRFERMNPGQNPISSDTQGGYQSNPEPCGVGEPESSPEYADVSLGGRAAEYRYWHLSCRDGRGLDIAQYTVVTPAPYQLSSDQATANVRAVMAEVARSATLPAATGSVRLYDHGIVRSAVTRPDGAWDITLDRVVVGRPNQSPATYAYRVPASAVPQRDGTAVAPEAAIGQTLDVFTDGAVVTQTFFYAG